MKNKESVPALTKEEEAQVLENATNQIAAQKEENLKQEACSKELGEVLDKHGYTLKPVTQISLERK